jgi:type IV fimbrial biogenesis protein FimT
MLVARGMISSQRTYLNRRVVAGFTLIELMVTIAIAAILATLAAPSFREYIVSQRIKNASFDLITALTLTRSEAITRNADVDLLRTGTDWANGWTIKPAIASPPTLHTQDAFKGLKITATPTGADTVTYGKDGRVTTAAVTFQIEPVSPIGGVKFRCVSIGLSGVPSSSVGGC